jgi:hypothetical protein
MAERIKLLVTVKTYPLPSTEYEETVCTAGVREDGSFIRLYPIDYRNRPYEQWYSKYQRIEVDAERSLRDPRPESYRPIGDITSIGEPIPTEKSTWNERKRYVLSRPLQSMCDLDNTAQSKISLGLIKPRVVEDFICQEADRDWKPQLLTQMKQMHLFGFDRKPLEKIPYKFSYIFKCEKPGCKGHRKMIEDWEVGQLYRTMRNKFHNDKVACEKVREQFFNKMCDPGRDTHFFVGTVLEHATWVILGVFWPKKVLDHGMAKNSIR